jgi:hypothetical protein
LSLSIAQTGYLSLHVLEGRLNLGAVVGRASELRIADLDGWHGNGNYHSDNTDPDSPPRGAVV